MNLYEHVTALQKKNEELTNHLRTIIGNCNPENSKDIRKIEHLMESFKKTAC